MPQFSFLSKPRAIEPAPRGPFDRTTPPTEADVRRRYERPSSFTNHLPWLDYDPEHQVFLLDDGRNVGALFEIRPAGVEARPEAWLAEFRDKIQQVSRARSRSNKTLGSSNSSSMTSTGSMAWPTRWRPTRGSKFATWPIPATGWLCRDHCANIARPGGLFHDDQVTGGPWQGNRRKVHACLFRRRSATPSLKGPDELGPIRELNEAAVRLTAGLESTGVGVRRLGGRDLYEWMLRWFNPRPAVTAGDVEALLALAPYPGDDHEDRPYGYDFGEALVLGLPRYHPEKGLWWFDGLPHRAITIQQLTDPPTIGQFFAERRIGRHLYAVFDRLPPGVVMAITVEFQPQDDVRERLVRVERAAIGDYAEAQLAGEDAKAAQFQIAQGNKLFPTQITFYLRGEDEEDLRRKQNQLHSLLLTNHLRPIDERQDLCALDTYLRRLPMGYDHRFDRKRARRSRFMFARHLSNLVPLYGRSTGTGHPGILVYNRGGEPLTFDPIVDRKSNAHALILGPTGAGKSSLLVYLLLHIMAVHRPRLFIIDGASSFRLFGQYLEAQGLSVNYVQVRPKSDVSLPPFAEIGKLLDPKHRRRLDLDLAGPEDLDDADDTASKDRDFLGEAEIAARLMITGGDAKEEARLTRADRLLIREAIVEAARQAVAAQRQPLTEDVAHGLRHLPGLAELDPPRRARVLEMADALSLFCTEGSLEAKLFNRPGQLWPEADVTVFEMGVLAQEGYEDKLTVAYISLMNHIHALVEQHQYEGRPTLVLTDEAHIVTTNPLLAPYVVKISKMWRRYGAWLWLATQNLQDFPDAARRMLNMMEWWLCLSMPPEEAEQIARFRELSAEERALLLAATKEPGKYTEGVVLSRALKALFRNVPPPIALALAMTEKDEKAERAALMKQQGCTELEAALKVAERIARKRSSVFTKEASPS